MWMRCPKCDEKYRDIDPEGGEHAHACPPKDKPAKAKKAPTRKTK